VTAKTRSKPVREVGPRRYGVGDCLWPLLVGMACVAVTLLLAGWEQAYVVRLLVPGLGGGVAVAVLRIWDMGPWRVKK
jgi:hypothetical protein